MIYLKQNPALNFPQKHKNNKLESIKYKFKEKNMKYRVVLNLCCLQPFFPFFLPFIQFFTDRKIDKFHHIYYLFSQQMNLLIVLARVSVS